MTQPTDIIIIGGGHAGCSAAIRAGQLGMKVTLIERDQIGGACMNWGSISTKALLRSVEVLSLLKRAGEFGLVAKGANFDFKKLVERSRKVATQAAANIKHIVKEHRVEIVEGQAKLLGKGKVEVSNGGKVVAELSARHIIIATGSRPIELPGMEPDGKMIWGYKDATRPEFLPKTMLIVGAGSSGIEFASFYKALGVDVTVVEISDRILPNEDEDISACARKIFEKQGIKFTTGATVKKFDKNAKNVTVTIEQGVRSTLSTFDCVIMAIGAVPNTENIGIENTKARIESGHIQISQWCITDESGVYAIGDVVGNTKLAHKSAQEGVVCVERIGGVIGVHPVSYDNIPSCVHSIPQIAMVGMTEKAARSAGYGVRTGKSSISSSNYAAAMGETDGLIKTVFDSKTGSLLGAHMVGHNVSEMIQGYAIARSLETTERELMQTMFPCFTVSEMMREAVLDAYKKI
ncbi:MAG: dihydrolipoyl dehydrogenase [Alphaproteobacteria bacterium]|nr:dihydrolipoyl dehydrogenase [Alphaproteobacteria bacterium]